MNRASIIRDTKTGDIRGLILERNSVTTLVSNGTEIKTLATVLRTPNLSLSDIAYDLPENLHAEKSVPVDRHLIKSLEKHASPTQIKKLTSLVPHDAFIQDGKTHPTMGTSIVRKDVKQLAHPQTHLYHKPLHLIPAEERQAAINFKARRFRTEQKVAALNIQVKRVRALFDPNIGPGGGWRCPDGTLHGGQITDRFGRGCGGGLTRRIGRALMRAGRRLDNIGEGRDRSRLERAAERATRAGNRAQRVREGRRAVANRLDAAADRLVGDFGPPRGGRRRDETGVPGARVREPRRPSASPQRGLRDSRQRQREQDEINEFIRRRNLPNEILAGGERGRPWADMTDEELEEARQRNLPPTRTDDRIGLMPDSPDEKRRKEANLRAIENEQAIRRGERPRDAVPEADAPEGRRPGRRPTEQRRPARPRDGEGRSPAPRPRPDAERDAGGDEDDPFDFIEDPEERQRVKDALGPYAEIIAEMLRDRRDRDRPRRERRRDRDGGGGAGGGGAGRRQRDGEDQQEGEDRSLLQRIMDALAKAFQRIGEFRENRRENRERRRERRQERRTQIADALDDAAQRVLGEERRGSRRDRRGPQRDQERRDLEERAREAADRILPDGDPDEFARKERDRRWREERGIPDNVRSLDDKEIDAIAEILDEEERNADPDFDPFNDLRRETIDGLNAERARRVADRAREADDDLGGSLPDDRSLRNVRNRFPRRGLPRRAYWRDRNRDGYNEADEAEMNRRFGRYYDDDGKLNARGRYVNEQLRNERDRSNRPLSADDRENIEDRANDQFDRDPSRPLEQLEDETPRDAEVPDVEPAREEVADVRRRILREDDLARAASFRDQNNRDGLQRLVERLDNDISEVDALIERAREDREPDRYRDLIRLRNDIAMNRRIANGYLSRVQRGDRDRAPEAPGDADRPRTPGQLDGLSDDQILAALRGANDEDDLRANGLGEGRGLDPRALSNDELQRVQEIIDNNPDAFRDRDVDGVQQAHPAVNLIGPEYNRRQDNGLFTAPDVDAPAGGQLDNLDDGDILASLRGLRSINDTPPFNMEDLSNDELMRLQRLVDAGLPDRNGERHPAVTIVGGEVNRRQDLGLLNAPAGDAADDLGGSVPTTRSFRNVYNQFRTRGLPQTPTWRDRNRRGYSEEREAALDGRFRRYYDENGQLNARGRYVNERLEEYRNRVEGRPGVPDVERVINDADREYDRDNPIVIPPVDQINPDDPIDQEIFDRSITSMREESLRRHNAILAELSDAGEDTPNAINEADRYVSEILAQRRIAERRLRLHQDGTRPLADEEVADLTRFINRIDAGLQDLLGSDPQIVDENYDNGPRAAFLRSRYGVLAGISENLDGAAVRRNGGSQIEGIREALALIKQTEEIGQIEPDSYLERAVIRGIRSLTRSELEQVITARTGLDLASFRNFASEIDIMERRLRINFDEERALFNADNVDDILANLPDYMRNQREYNLAAQRMATYLYMNERNVRRTEAASDFVEELQRDLRERHPDMAGMPNVLAINLDEALAGNLETLERMNQGGGRFMASLMSPIDEMTRDELDKNKDFLEAMLRGSAVAAGNAWMDGGDRGPMQRVGRAFAGQLALNPALQTKMRQRLAEINARRLQVDNLPDAVNARNVRQVEDAVNDVADRFADTEAPAVMARIIDDVKMKRRKRLSQLLISTYGSDSVFPWKRRRDTQGDPPVSPQKILDFRNNWPSMSEAQKQEAKEFLRQAFTVKYESNGILYETDASRIDVSWTQGGFLVNGPIYATGPNGQRKTVGSFKRNIGDADVGSDTVYSAILSIDLYDLTAGRAVSYDPRTRKYTYGDGTEVPRGTPLTRDSGFGTAFNNHAWGWLRDAGFKNVGVTAGLEDGRYVWGRFGYRTASNNTNRAIWGAADTEVRNFRNGQQSIIKTEKQAQLIEYLSAQASAAGHDWKVSPERMELILALEHGAEDQFARRQEVRSWIMANMPVGSAKINLATWDISADYEALRPQADAPEPAAAVGNLLPFLRPAARLDPRLGDVAEPGLLPGDLPVPRQITNAQVRTPEEAAEFIRNGGSLNEVPNDFWPEALEANASTADNDRNSLFQVVSPNEGMIGTLRIYMLRDADGNPTSQGWVIKASTAQRDGNGRIQDDTWSEVAGWNLAAAAGLSPQGAMYGGVDRTGRQRVVIPLGSNIGPEGARLTRSAGSAYSVDMANNANDSGFPPRLTHFLHNYFLAVSDRNPGNGITYSDQDGNFYVMPLDLARTGASRYATLQTYADNFSMDRGIFRELSSLMGRRSAEERQQLRQTMLEAYDDMVTRYRSVIAGGRDAFIQRMSIGSASQSDRMNAMRDERLGAIYDVLKRRLNDARANRTVLETMLGG